MKPRPVHRIDPARGLRTWVLHSTGAGANRQLLNLAAAIGGSWEVKHVLDSPFRAVLDRLYPPARRHIPAHKRDALRPPWPDIVLIGGGRSLIDALRIKTASGGRSRIVCVGRPAAPLDSVDLVITTPQYGLPEHQRILHLSLPLNQPDEERLAAAARAWKARFEELPRPWFGVLLGGDSGSCRFTPAAATALGQRLNSRAAATGGALLLTTSPRTPGAARDALRAELSAPHFFHTWKPADPENPLDAILGLADGFVVTADSASMLAEACATGRPVASVELPLRWRARLVSRNWLPEWLGPVRARLLALRRRGVIAGRWIPARDMQRIHDELRSRGLVCGVDDLGGRGQALAAGLDERPRAVAAIRALFD